MNYRKLLKESGGTYIGIQKNPYGEDLLLFNDILTGSTLSLRLSLVSGDNIQERIRESRKVFIGEK